MICTVVGVVGQSCTATYFLPKGQIVTQGVISSRLIYELAVVGGTGLYSNVRGTLTVTSLNRQAGARAPRVPVGRVTSSGGRQDPDLRRRAALRELMRVALVGDYAFEEAGTVSEAIEVASGFRPDVALVDVMMPGGSGLDVIRRLADDPMLRDAHCVVVSAFAAEADRQEAPEAGADGFVSKPFDPDELSATVASLLDGEH